MPRKRPLPREDTIGPPPSNELMIVHELDQIIERATQRVEGRTVQQAGPVSIADTRASIDRLRAYRRRFAIGHTLSEGK